MPRGPRFPVHAARRSDTQTPFFVTAMSRSSCECGVRAVVNALANATIVIAKRIQMIRVSSRCSIDP